jgi:hypothetical protein
VLYQLKHGEHEKLICQQWARGDFGPVPMPEFLRKKPRCPAWAQLYMDAYWDLNGDRGGMGDGRILWTACHMWARAHGLNSRQEADLCYYVKAMDGVMLSYKK